MTIIISGRDEEGPWLVSDLIERLGGRDRLVPAKLYARDFGAYGVAGPSPSRSLLAATNFDELVTRSTIDATSNSDFQILSYEYEVDAFWVSYNHDGKPPAFCETGERNAIGWWKEAWWSALDNGQLEWTAESALLFAAKVADISGLGWVAQIWRPSGLVTRNIRPGK